MFRFKFIDYSQRSDISSVQTVTFINHIRLCRGTSILLMTETHYLSSLLLFLLFFVLLSFVCSFVFNKTLNSRFLLNTKMNISICRRVSTKSWNHIKLAFSLPRFWLLFSFWPVLTVNGKKKFIWDIHMCRKIKPISNKCCYGHLFFTTNIIRYSWLHIVVNEYLQLILILYVVF